MAKWRHKTLVLGVHVVKVVVCVNLRMLPGGTNVLEQATSPRPSCRGDGASDYHEVMQ